MTNILDKIKAVKILDFFFFSIFLLLFIYFSAETIILNNADNPTIISYPHAISNYNAIENKKLYSGDTIKFTIHAKEYYLSTISIRLKEQQQDLSLAQQDKIIFRIKQKGASSWIQENT